MDEYLLLLANSILGHSQRIDNNLFFLGSNALTKGVPLITFFWAFWFVRRDGVFIHRSQVLASLIIAIVSILIGRILAVTLPFRLRPIHSGDVEVTTVNFLSNRLLDGWSSMPSDHAVFFATLCTCVFMMNRTAGILIGIYSFLIVLMPRIIFGLHWPSDVAVGMIVGILIAVLLMKPVRHLIDRSGLLDVALRHEVVFYPAMFLLTFQMATMFESLRKVLGLAASTVFFLVQSI